MRLCGGGGGDAKKHPDWLGLSYDQLDCHVTLIAVQAMLACWIRFWLADSPMSPLNWSDLIK
jgi:hypothetical protein